MAALSCVPHTPLNMHSSLHNGKVVQVDRVSLPSLLLAQIITARMICCLGWQVASLHCCVNMAWAQTNAPGPLRNTISCCACHLFALRYWRSKLCANEMATMTACIFVFVAGNSQKRGLSFNVLGRSQFSLNNLEAVSKPFGSEWFILESSQNKFSTNLTCFLPGGKGKHST